MGLLGYLAAALTLTDLLLSPQYCAMDLTCRPTELTLVELPQALTQSARRGTVEVALPRLTGTAGGTPRWT